MAKRRTERVDLDKLASLLDATADELRASLAEASVIFRSWRVRGGKERAKRLTAKQRRDIARKAARARWKKKRSKGRRIGGCRNLFRSPQ